MQHGQLGASSVEHDHTERAASSRSHHREHLFVRLKECVSARSTHMQPVGDFQHLKELVDDHCIAVRRRFLATVPVGNHRDDQPLPVKHHVAGG